MDRLVELHATAMRIYRVAAQGTLASLPRPGDTMPVIAIKGVMAANYLAMFHLPAIIAIQEMWRPWTSAMRATSKKG